MKRLCLFALLAILPLTACGGGGETPTQVVNAYHKALMAKDLDAVMALMVSTADRGKVESLLETRAKGLERAGLPPVVEERTDGDKAVVVCKFGPMQQDVNLVKEKGHWKVKD